MTNPEDNIVPGSAVRIRRGWRVTIRCVQCGQERSVTLTQAKKLNTCGSPDCVRQGQRERALIASEKARNPVSIAKHQATKRNKWITVTCGCGCGETFDIPPYRPRHGKVKMFFVNPSHFYAFNRGENNVRWRGGGFDYDWEWRKLAAQVRDRDKVCRHCGKTPEANGRALDVHHIEPFRVVGHHDMDNLIALCCECHGATQVTEQVVYPTRKQFTCTMCQTVFTPEKPGMVVCGEECHRERRRRWDRAQSQKKRAKRISQKHQPSPLHDQMLD